MKLRLALRDYLEILLMMNHLMSEFYLIATFYIRKKLFLIDYVFKLLA